MKPLVPYSVESQILLMGSQTFYVDPNVSNDGQVFPVAGSKPNYPYQLPFLAHTFPVRRIRVLLPTQLEVSPAIASTIPSVLTLRKSDGTFLLNQIPICEFYNNIPTYVTERDLLFDADFFPDPRYSFLQWTTAGLTERVGMEFFYG